MFNPSNNNPLKKIGGFKGNYFTDKIKLLPERANIIYSNSSKLIPIVSAPMAVGPSMTGTETCTR